nr:hypothetical protein [Paracidovorax oryzae]
MVDRARGLLDALQDVSEPVAHEADGMHQAAVVAAPQGDVGLQVAFGHAQRGPGRRGGLAAHRALDVAHDEAGDHRNADAEQGEHAQGAVERAAEGLLDVVHVVARHQVPVPGLEAHRIADLGAGGIAAGPWPPVLEEAAALRRTAGGRDIDIQRRALGILERQHVPAVEFGLDRMHHHGGVGSHDRHVPVLAVTLRRHAFPGRAAGLLLRHFSGPGLLVVVADDGQRHVGDVGQCGAPRFVLERACLPGIHESEGEEAQQGQDEGKPELLPQSELFHGVTRLQCGALSKPPPARSNAKSRAASIEKIDEDN